MTVSKSASGNRAQVDGNGVTSSVAIDWTFWDQNDLKVIHTNSSDVDTVWSYGVAPGSWAFTGGGGSTGTVTFTAADLATGERLTVIPAAKLDQPENIDVGRISLSSMERALDKLAARVQREAERVDRAPKLKESTESDAPTFPEPSAGKAIIWNSAGDDLVNGPTADEVENAQTYAETASTKATESAASASEAQAWATTAENTVVSGGLYSSFHYMKKSQAAQTAAENAASQLEIAQFVTKADLEAATVQSSQKAAELSGYTDPGDGGGFSVKRVDSEPTHEGKVRSSDRYISDGTTDATNGGWWEIVNDIIDIRMLGAVGNNSTDNTTAIRNALNIGRSVYIPIGKFRISGELEVKTEGQIIFGAGAGFANGDQWGIKWPTSTSQIVVRTGVAGRVLTRRNYRGSDSDPEDDAISVAFNVQAEGVRLKDFCVFLDCNYSDSSSSNFGQDCDVGIFSNKGGQTWENVAVVGYFRKAGMYFDNTLANNLPEYTDLDGSLYPEASVRNGIDRNTIINPMVCGALQCIAILGAKPESGQTSYNNPYYDETLGTTVSDDRGGFGASNFVIENPHLICAHHSGYRRADPASSPLSPYNEGEDAPAAVYIDGLSSNDGDNMRLIEFRGGRIRSEEMFMVRLGYRNSYGGASRVRFHDVHIDPEDNGSRKDTSGTTITILDFTNNTYGRIAANPKCRDIYWDGANIAEFGPYFEPSDLSFGSGVTMGSDIRPLPQITVTLEDDAATSFNPPHSGGMCSIFCGFTGGGTNPQVVFSGSALYDVGTSADVSAVFSGVNFETSTGALAGTTGTNGKVTISPHSDGKIYLENRSGAERDFRITFPG